MFFPRDEEGKVNMERGVYDTNNKPKRANFQCGKEGPFCLGVAKLKSKEDRTITRK